MPSITIPASRQKFALAMSLSDDLSILAARAARSVVMVHGSPQSSGSGVLWDRRGFVVTNHHVVPTDDAVVSFTDGQRLRARVVARDSAVDLAILELGSEVPADTAIPAAIGNSTRLRIGDLVIAVGNPIGERNAVTLGMVQGTLTRVAAGASSEVLRLGITLRPGNSGGALVDTRGLVVGIPNMVIGAGQGLAVPSEVVERVLQHVGRAASEDITWV